MTQKLIKALCKPELLIMGPVQSSALARPIKIPVHFSSRKIYSFPDSLQIIASEVGKIVKKLKVDRIAGGATAGIPLVSITSLVTKIPMIYVRDVPVEKNRARFPIEGVIKPNDKVALLDDSLAAGEHKKNFIKNIENAGGKVTDLIIIWNCSTKGMEGEKEMKQMGVKVHFLTTWQNWFFYMGKLGYLSKDLTTIMLDFIDAPYGFQDKKEFWQKFEEIKEKQKGKFK